MAHVVTEADTTASPERVIRALTDFSSKRFELWPTVDRAYFKVESSGDTHAEVTEGNGALGGIWEKGKYDWSTPGTVRIDVTDSNAFAPGSYWVYRVTSRSDGGSHVHMEFDRRPRGLKGQVASALFKVAGSRIYGKQLRETLHRIEVYDRPRTALH